MMDCQVWHRGHRCKKSFLWHWITAQLYVSNAAFVVYQHALAHTRTFKKRDTHMWASDMQEHSGALTFCSERNEGTRQRGFWDQCACILQQYSRLPKAFYSCLACSRAHACVYNDTNTPEPAICVSCFPMCLCVCVTWFYILLRCLIRQCWRRTRRLAQISCLWVFHKCLSMTHLHYLLGVYIKRHTTLATNEGQELNKTRTNNLSRY